VTIGMVTNPVYEIGESMRSENIMFNPVESGASPNTRRAMLTKLTVWQKSSKVSLIQ
jgi:hypothetical protein